jgi:hypothetical protein
VTPGADVNGVDLLFRPERGYRIAGRVTHPDGRPARVSVVLATSDRSGAIDLGQVVGQTDADGSFTFGNVAPGEYVVQTGPMRGAQGTVRTLAAGSSEFGAAFVTVRDGDPAPIEVGLKPATTLAGRITYEGPQPSASQSLPMTIRPVDRDMNPRTTVLLPGFSGNRNGTFELGGLFGQAYLAARSPRPEWYVKSIMVNGQDILDTPYDFGSGRTIAGAEIVVSSMTATASGRVTDERLAPARDSTVVIFPASRDKWASGSQWVKTARPVQDATFRIPGMPPGEYWIAAIDRIDEGATASEPGLLDSLSFRATRISLNEGQTQDVTLRLIRR